MTGDDHRLVPSDAAEALLRESEARFRATFEQAAVGMAHVAPDGRWLRVNQRLCEIVGYGREELLARTFGDVTHPDDLAADWDLAQRLLSGEAERYQMEKRYRRGDGSVVWARLSVSLVRDEATGAPLYFISAVEDIDARKRAEAALAQREADYVRSMESAHVGTWKWWPETDALQTSGLIYGISGHPEPIRTTMTAAIRQIFPPEDCEPFMTALRRAAAEGGDHEFEHEHRALGADGRMRWVLATGRMGVGEDVFYGASQDITARKEAEIALRESEERHRATFDRAAVGIAHVGRDGAWLRINRRFSEIIGYTLDELKGTTFEDITHPDDLDADLAQVRRVLAGEIDTYSIEKRYIRKGGGPVWVNLTASVVHGAEGRPAYFIAVIEDIDARKRAAAAVQESEARLSGIIESAMDAILVVDEDQRLVRLNPAAERMFGYSADEALGQPLSLLLPERFRGAHAGHVRGFGDSGVTGRSMGALGALTARRRDGTEFPIEAAISQTRTASGGALFTAVVRDITERRQLEEERAHAAAKQEQIAEALQRSLLLVPPPDAFPGVSVKAVYEPASDDALIGGDFFDVFAVDDDRIALVVGDVTGKGLAAATYTAEVKFAFRAFLREDAGPAAALSRLNRFVARAARFDKAHLGATYVAAAVAVVDTLTGALWCSSAGMEPPLLVNTGAPAGGMVSELTVSELTAGGPLLGVLPEAEYEAQEAELAPGTILAMTTDGITEARRAGAFFGLEGLAAAVGESARRGAPLGEIGRAVAARAREFAGGQRQDDMCLLLARRRP